MSEFGDRVRLVVRDFPLSQHANARKAAEAAEAAREQGKYWEYAAVLFRNQSALGVDKLRQYATEVGLDRARFDASLDSGKFAEKVQRDLVDGRKLGINGTPTLYINGKRISDNSYASLKSAIETALKAQATLKARTKDMIHRLRILELICVICVELLLNHANVSFSLHSRIQIQTFRTQLSGLVLLQPTVILRQKQTAVRAWSTITFLHSLYYRAKVIVVEQAIELREVNIRDALVTANDEHVLIVLVQSMLR